jgi:hypothetical protein
MLASIKDFIKKQLTECEPTISLEQVELLGDKKIAATISTSHLMGSVEILEDLTIDLLIVEFDSEDVVYSKTFDSVSNTEELREIIKRYLHTIDDAEAQRCSY